MRATNPQKTEAQLKEERETKLKSFILANLEEDVGDGAKALLVLAQSPASPVVGAVLALSDGLARRGIGAQIILAGGPMARENETWNLVFSASFIHEIRLTSQPRVLDGHEQLVVGGSAVWFGDTMRRDPLKRDAFEKFATQAAPAGRAARVTFERLWGLAHPIYAALSPAYATIAKVPLDRPTASAGTVVEHGDNAAMQAARPDMEAPVSPLSIKDGSILETLEAWLPSTRH